MLICTDLIARGLDFKAVNMVVNYDLPQSAVSYIHRIGRTGRAGACTDSFPVHRIVVGSRQPQPQQTFIISSFTPMQGGAGWR